MNRIAVGAVTVVVGAAGIACGSSTGNVWYFGENTAELQNGVVTTTAGTWEAGVDNALPGIVTTGGGGHTEVTGLVR